MGVWACSGDSQVLSGTGQEPLWKGQAGLIFFVTWESGGICPHHPFPSPPPFIPLSSFFLCFYVPPSLLHPCTLIPPRKLERGGGCWPQVHTAQVIVDTILACEGRGPSPSMFL